MSEEAHQAPCSFTRNASMPGEFQGPAPVKSLESAEAAHPQPLRLPGGRGGEGVQLLPDVRRRHGLQQVAVGPDLEGRHGVLRVGGHKDELRLRGDVFKPRRQLQAGHLPHLHPAEHHRGTPLRRRQGVGGQGVAAQLPLGLRLPDGGQQPLPGVGIIVNGENNHFYDTPCLLHNSPVRAYLPRPSLP